jgi:hypothetical protein
VAGNSSPDIDARTILTVRGLFHALPAGQHPLLHAFRKAVEIGAERQGGVTLNPYKATSITIEGEQLVAVVNSRTSLRIKPEELGLLLSGEPLTMGGGVREAGTWLWDLTRHRFLRPFVTADARQLLIKLDDLLGVQPEQSYVPVSPETLPRALDHLNVVWKVVTNQRLFYPRSLATATSLVEPVGSGDELTARLGALADIFDLFMRTATGGSPPRGSLTAFREALTDRLSSEAAQEQAQAAVERLVHINRIRNGRLHTDATNWAESLQRLGVPSSEVPGQQWVRIRSVTVDAVYGIIGLLEPLIVLAA